MNRFRNKSIVFSTKVDGEKLHIRPMMVIDLRRSTIVVDPKLGGTVVVDTWGERTIAEPKSPENKLSVNTSALGISDIGSMPSMVRSQLEIDPKSTIQKLLSLWSDQLAQNDPSRDKRIAQVRQISTLMRAADIEDFVTEVDTSTYEEWKKHIVSVIEVLTDSKHASPETFLRAALSIAKRSIATDPTVTPAETPEAWSFLAKASENPKDEAIKLGAGGVEFHKEFDILPQVVVAFFIKHAKDRDPLYIEAALNQRSWPSQPSTQEKLLRETRNRPQSRIDLEVNAIEEMKRLLQQRSHLLVAERELNLDSKDDPWHSINDQVKAAAAIEGSDYISFALDGLLKHIDEAKNNVGTNQTIVKLNISAELHRLSSALMSEATELNHRYDSVRYSGDHEKLSARIEFENGAYAKALRRYFQPSLPVALSSPLMAWQILPGDFKGIPKKLAVRRENENLVVQAKNGEIWSDVLKIQGIAPKDAEGWITNLIATDSAMWSDGELVSEQILTLPLQTRRELTDVTTGILSHEVWLAALKAMVYGCVPPGYDLVKLSGRCAASDINNVGVSKLHESITMGSSDIHERTHEELLTIAEQRFGLNVSNKQ